MLSLEQDVTRFELRSNTRMETGRNLSALGRLDFIHQHDQVRLLKQNVPPPALELSARIGPAGVDNGVVLVAGGAEISHLALVARPVRLGFTIDKNDIVPLGIGMEVIPASPVIPVSETIGGHVAQFLDEP